MCGIAGYLDFDRKVNLKTLYEMTNIVKYRGPDDEGYLLFSENESVLLAGNDTAKDCCIEKKIEDILDSDINCYLGFGHRRLSIIDLSSAGHQPMSVNDGMISITFNGEIYNYIEVRNTLMEEGVSFSTDTDTEVILKAYERWGEGCVNHFNGMWSFAIYDKSKHKLFCSRDRLGAKPFYYYVNNNHFVFGSEIKQICLDETLPKKMNDKQLLTTLLFRIQDFSEETLISNVKALQGGYNLVLNINEREGKIMSVKKYQYWDIDTSKRTNNSNWYKKIQTAIQIRLRSDAPVGVMVSGGVDSTFLLNEICRYKEEKQTQDINNLCTFTSCYKNSKEHDETYFAHMVNKAWGTNEQLIYPDELDTLSAYEQMIWHYEDYAPFSNLGSFMTLKEVAKSDVKVIINGQGGDETMLGYERYYAYYLRDVIRKKPIKGLRVASYIVRNSNLSYGKLFKYIIYFGIPKFRIKRNLKKGGHYLSDKFIENFDIQEAMPLFECDTLDELIYKELRKTQLTHILRMDDRGYMTFSLESRVPFIDYEYVEEAVKIPPMKKIQNGYTKYLLRKKMQGTIPKEVIWRKNKNGWSSPAMRWIERFDRKKVNDMIMNPVSERYFNMDYIKKQWIENPTGHVMEAFFFTEIFMRKFHLK